MGKHNGLLIKENQYGMYGINKINILRSRNNGRIFVGEFMNWYIIYYANKNMLGKTETELNTKILKQVFGRNAKAYRKIKNVFELVVASILLKRIK